MSSYL